MRNSDSSSIGTQKRDNIFFLKAHKCGSSTVQNILLRYGRENRLLFVLPSRGNYVGHPKLFQPSMIAENLRSEDNTYNIFTHHSRYNPVEVKQIMRSNAAFVTILRDPGTLFESIFNYFHLDKKLNVTFERFKKDPDKYASLADQRRATRYGRNQMCFDLGLDTNASFSKDSVREFIRNIERDFHFVMISEHMEVSLVLLADLMGWRLEQVAFLSSNVRQPRMKTNLTEKEKQKLREFNQMDTELYSHFLEIFKNKIIAYGVDRMKEQVQTLISMNADLYHQCVESSENKGYAKTLSYVIRPGAPPKCYLAAITELAFTEQLRNEQMHRLSELKKIDLLVKVESNERNTQSV